MTIADVSSLLTFILQQSVAPALIICLTQWGANVLIGAVTGRGLRLSGKL